MQQKIQAAHFSTIGLIMKKNNFYQLATMAVCSLLVTSCASPYIGRSVNTNYEGVCNFQHFPASCSSIDENLSIEYQIEKTGKVGEYQVTGTAENLLGGNFSNYHSFTLYLLLVHNSTVVDSIAVMGRTGLNAKNTTLSRTFFTPNEFEASLATYSFTYK
jgi:hypothetical protein